jgi:hypothetical protein
VHVLQEHRAEGMKRQPSYEYSSTQYYVCTLCVWTFNFVQATRQLRAGKSGQQQPAAAAAAAGAQKLPGAGPDLRPRLRRGRE